MIITADTKMADVIHLNYYLISVIYRFGINLGFGDDSVEEACRKNNVNIDFFLQIVNAFHDEEYFPQSNLKSFSIQLIIEYLRKTHNYYLEIKIPELEILINEMVNLCYPKSKDVELVNKFFNEYKEELHNHIKREEEVAFPYAIKIEEAYLSKDISEELKNELMNYSINKYKSEHDDLEEKPFDLKNIIIKYLPPPSNNYICSKVIDELYHLEKDLNDHARIEEKVMVPKITEMEDSLKKRIA
ncbi:hemerythrin domain-containing protein [Bacteroidota bacterium]